MRGCDSVHVAAAEAVHSALRGRSDFLYAGFDAELMRAAKGADLPLLEV